MRYRAIREEIEAVPLEFGGRDLMIVEVAGQLQHVERAVFQMFFEAPLAKAKPDTKPTSQHKAVPRKRNVVSVAKPKPAVKRAAPKPSGGGQTPSIADMIRRAVAAGSRELHEIQTFCREKWSADDRQVSNQVYQLVYMKKLVKVDGKYLLPAEGEAA